jgi:hypothetical protein
MSEKRESLDRQIEEAVDRLLTNGRGDKATRLVLIDDDSEPGWMDLGGWGRDSLRRHLRMFAAALGGSRGAREHDKGCADEIDHLGLCVDKRGAVIKVNCGRCGGGRLIGGPSHGFRPCPECSLSSPSTPR